MKKGPKHKCALNRVGIFCLRVGQENYPEVNLVPDVPDISILCRRTEELPRTSIKSEFSPPQKENLLCCRQNSISYQSKFHFGLKTYELTFVTIDAREFLHVLSLTRQKSTREKFLVSIIRMIVSLHYIVNLLFSPNTTLYPHAWPYCKKPFCAVFCNKTTR